VNVRAFSIGKSSPSFKSEPQALNNDRKSRPTKETMHHEPLVLIVDNDPDMRELLETLFKLIGFATFSVGSSE